MVRKGMWLGIVLLISLISISNVIGIGFCGSDINCNVIYDGCNRPGETPQPRYDAVGNCIFPNGCDCVPVDTPVTPTVMVPYGFRYYQTPKYDVVAGGNIPIDCWLSGGDCNSGMFGTGSSGLYTLIGNSPSGVSADASTLFNTIFSKKYTAQQAFTGVYGLELKFDPDADHSSVGGSNADLNEMLGAIAYGYLYSLDKLSVSNYKVGAHSTANEAWCTHEIFEFNKILNKNIESNGVSCGGTEICDGSGGDFSYAANSCNINLDSGLYFIKLGMVGTVFKHTIKSGYNIGSSLALTGFNNIDASTTNTLINNNGPKYIITQEPLNASQLNVAFGNYTENTSWLCHLAGGMMLNETKDDKGLVLTDFGNSVFNNPNGFNMSHFCCGDDEDGAENYIYTSGQNVYSCSNNQWTTNTLNIQCALLVPGSDEKNVYNSQVNYIPYSYDDMKNKIFNGSDGCCGDDALSTGNNQLGDYGYIFNNGTRSPYLCYNPSISTPTDFSWLTASFNLNAYKIKTIKTLSGDVDVVSNSKDWYYCNATQNIAINGFPIQEGGTFANNININSINDGSTCAEKANFKLGLEGNDKAFIDGCDANINNNCCENDTATNKASTTSLYDCVCHYSSDPTTIINFILIAEGKSPELIDQEHPDFSGAGVDVNIGGVDVSNNNNFYDNWSAINNLVTKNNNDSFICFKENISSNIISQCCFDSNCANKNTFIGSGPSKLSITYFNNRILARNAAIHTIDSFDIFNNSLNSGVLRKARKDYFTSQHTSIIYFAPIKAFNLNLSTFDYLEFEIAYNSSNPTFAKDLSIKINNDGKELKFYDYSTNGYQPYLWHHVIIPINTDNIGVAQQGLYKITFTDSSKQNGVLILDSIIVSANSTNALKYNTKNYYCSGGFGSWVDDLDSSAEDIKLDSVAISKNIIGPNIGPHMFACVGDSYDWTGTQCCGDDTRLGNVKEYFNDTTGGCFAGSKVFNTSRVSDAKGYSESTNKSVDELDSYEYKNILYNSSFVGCQMTVDNLNKINLSYDGNPTTNNLITSNVKNQCTVIGNYYCKDGAWRQKIDTNRKLDDTFSNAANYHSSLTLKTIPSGVELIKNGFIAK